MELTVRQIEEFSELPTYTERYGEKRYESGLPSMVSFWGINNALENKLWEYSATC